MQKQIWLLCVRNAFYKSFKAKSERAIRLNSCESIFIIFATPYVNSSRQNRFKYCNLPDMIHIFLDMEHDYSETSDFIVRFYSFIFSFNAQNSIIFKILASGLHILKYSQTFANFMHNDLKYTLTKKECAACMIAKIAEMDQVFPKARDNRLWADGLENVEVTSLKF